MTLAFSSQGVLVGLPGEVSPVPNVGVGVVSFTAYCGVDHVVGSILDAAGFAPYRGCLPCDNGLRSLGGIAHECENCTAVECPAMGQNRFRTAIDASASGLASGDAVSLLMLPRTRAGEADRR